MKRIYFDRGRSVKPDATKQAPVASTYHITLGGQRLSVRATHHDLLEMLPGIMSNVRRTTPELRA
ncbi:hypothetical protein [Desulfovibrio sp. QI0434]